MSVSTVSRNESVATRFFAWAVTPRGAITLWLAYILAMALIRYSLSHTLMTDDVGESLMTQEFRLGYQVRNPPLWEWILWAIQQAVGPGFLSHLIMRYGALALMGIAVFRACFAASKDARWSSAVVLTTPLFHQIGWPLFDWGTHTILLLIICLLSIECAIRYAERPSYAAAAWMGVLIGLGFLAKYGFAFFLLALVAAMLWRKESRAALLRRESLLAPVIAILVMSPFIYWLVLAQADMAGTVEKVLIPTDAPWIERSLYGLRKLVENSLKFVFPWALFAALFIWLDRRRADALPIGEAGAGERFVGTLLLFSFIGAAIGLGIMGPTKFTGGYVVPIMVVAIPYGACLLSRRCTEPQAPLGFAALGIAVLVGMALFRLFYLSNSGFPENTYRRDMWPIDKLAIAMRAEGLDRGTLVTADRREGGNLRAALPSLRVLVGRQEENRPAIRGDQASACRLLWNETEILFPGERWARTGDREQAEKLADLAGRERRQFDIPWAHSYLGNQRTSRWVMVDLDRDDPLCR